MSEILDLRVRDLEPVELLQTKLDELGEYSCSIPTEMMIGRQWKRNLNAFDPLRKGLDPLWVVCEYRENDDPERVTIHSSRVIIVEPESKPEPEPKPIPAHRYLMYFWARARKHDPKFDVKEWFEFEQAILRLEAE